jgi:hypothetical protein
VALPKPDCVARPSDCADFDVLNELDGFNLLPRLSIPFDGSIDLTTATSANVFLVSLGSTLPGGPPSGHVVSIDQLVWDPDRTTLDVESDELLDQHSRYALVVTKDVHDPTGKEIKADKAFVDFVNDALTASTGDPLLDAYRSTLRLALDGLNSRGIVSRGRVVAASVFTTLSASANLEKMRDQVKATIPSAASFLLGPGGARTVFARSNVTGIVFRRQTSADPTAPLSNMTISLAALDAVAGAVGRIAFGQYSSPEYRIHPGEYIPQVGTLTGIPAQQGVAGITFVLFLPSSAEPASGYPVAIFGHGAQTDKMFSVNVAAKLAESGIATIAIDAPGTGFGARSAYSVSFTDGTSITLLSGGRGLDQDHDGRILDGEGGNPAPPRAMLVGTGRGDGHRQRAVDHMQLVRVIEAGMDVDGDGTADLDPSRIYYVGTSEGGRQGAIFLAVEPDVRAGVLNVPNSASEERFSSARDRLGAGLQSRVPSLINSPGVASFDGISVIAPRFNENLPLRHGAPYSATLEDGATQTVQSPVVNTVAGAIDIQEAIERAEWGFAQANAAAFASYMRRLPLPGVPPKAVIIQFPFGDRVIPNPATSVLLNAGDLADRATFYRNDLAFAVDPTPVPSAPNLYPHRFLQLFLNDPALTSIALQAQGQIASFFALDGTAHLLDPFDGTQITDPDLDGPIFETPIHAPLPTRLNYPLSGSLMAALQAGAAGGSFSAYRAPSDSRGHLPAALIASPVPYRGGLMTISFASDPSGSEAVLSIYDLGGRRVARLVGGGRSPAGVRFTWNGMNEHGAAVAPGVYLLRAESSSRTTQAKVIVLP